MVDGYHVGDVRDQMVRGKRISKYDNKFTRKINRTSDKIDRVSGANKNEKLQGRLNKMLDGYTPDQITNMGQQQIKDESGNMIDNPNYDAGKFAAYDKKMKSNRYQRISSNIAENERMSSLDGEKSTRQKNLEIKLANLQKDKAANETMRGFHDDGVNQGKNINLYSQDEMKGLIEAGGKAKQATAGSSSDKTIVDNPEDFLSLEEVTADAGVTSQGYQPNPGDDALQSGSEMVAGTEGAGGDGAGSDNSSPFNDPRYNAGNNERNQNTKVIDSTSVKNNFQPNKFVRPPMGNDPNKANKQTAFENLLANMGDSGLQGAPEVNIENIGGGADVDSSNSFGGPKLKFTRSASPFKQRNKYK